MAPATKVVVRLTADQRRALEALAHTGTQPAHALRPPRLPRQDAAPRAHARALRASLRAPILLTAAPSAPDSWPNERIAEALDISRVTVARTRQQFVAE